MRHDMYKVIVERPRIRASFARSRPDPVDLDCSPRQEGIRKRHTHRKHLNENLRPLQRYLAAQVGRPWDKVYSEMCAAIDRRNTVQQHIHQHIGDFVAIRVVEIDGALHEDLGDGRSHPLRDRYGSELYVDPCSGLLCRNRWRERARRQHRDECERKGSELSQQWRRVSPTVQLHKIDGIWYRIELAKITEAAFAQRQLDAVRKLDLRRCPRSTAVKGVPSSLELYGDEDAYAREKRQLSARELRRFALRNDNA